MDTKSQSHGKWRDILGNYIPYEFLTGKHTGCPLCGGKDRFRFDNKNGNGSYYCSQCGAGTGIHLLAKFHDVNHSEAWKLVEKVIGTAKQLPAKKTDKKKVIADILASCKHGGEFVSGYLASRYIQNSPETLLAGFYWLDGAKCQCMVAKAAKGSKLAGIHATYVSEGKKKARRMYAVEDGSMNGSAIRLHKLNGGDSIVIGEGIETSLSASELIGLPAWAAMDAQKLEVVQIPDQIKRIVIAGDLDDSFTGQKASYSLAKRLKSEGKKVDVIFPTIGKDFNDELKAKRTN
jgi:putative DNA primase/helicase